MKLTGIGSSILKPDVSSPLLAFLAPAIATSPSSLATSRFISSTHQRHTHRPLQRCFSTALPRRAPATSEALKEEETDSRDPVSPSVSSPQSQPRAPRDNDPAYRVPELAPRASPQTQSGHTAAINNLLGTLNMPRGSGTPEQRIRTNKFKSLQTPTATALRQESLASRDHSYNAMKGVMDMVQNGVSDSANKRGPPVRLDAYVGRSQEVDPRVAGKTLGRALAMLSIRLNENRVRQTAREQRFHERKGIKRKRLRSERWRKRFKEGFKGMVAKVRRMRAQGW